MSETTNLGVPYITAGQNQKEVTANAAFDRLDKALTETLEANLTSGNVTVTDTQYREALQIRAINATVSGRTVTLPARERITILRNDPANTQSVAFVRGSTTLTLAVGETLLARTDGTANGLVALLRGTGAGGGAGSVTVQDEGSGVAGAPHSTLNFVGAGVVATNGGGGVATITISGGGSGVTLEDEGTTVTGGPHTTLNFTGSGVTVTNTGSGEAQVAVSGGGGGNADGRTHVVPALSSFAWVNQNSTTANTRSYGISVSQPSFSGDNPGILKKTCPSTPYEVRVRVRCVRRLIASTAFQIGWRESSSGKLEFFSCYAGTSSSTVTVFDFTDPTTFSGTPAGVGTVNMPEVVEWVRLRDNGTNRFIDLSSDGDEWQQLFSFARTFLVPNEVYFAINNNQGGTGGLPMGLTVLSWEEI